MFTLLVFVKQIAAKYKIMQYLKNNVVYEVSQYKSAFQHPEGSKSGETAKNYYHNTTIKSS